jgi:hypothetical protein
MIHVLPASARRAAACAGSLALILAAGTACAANSGGSAASGTGGGGSTAAGPSATAGTGTAAATVTVGTSASAAGGAGTGPATASASARSAGGAGANGGPGTCQTSQLRGSTGAAQGAAGSVYVDIVFQNTGSQPCTLTGYPGVSFGAGDPVQQVGRPADRDPQVNPTIVTLIPNAHAFAVLQIGDAGNYPAGTCQPAPTSYLQVYPPNNTTQLRIPYSSTACRGDVVTLHIEAIQPGAGG